jgi:hypothetical protein
MSVERVSPQYVTRWNAEQLAKLAELAERDEYPLKELSTRFDLAGSLFNLDRVVAAMAPQSIQWTFKAIGQPFGPDAFGLYRQAMLVRGFARDWAGKPMANHLIRFVHEACERVNRSDPPEVTPQFPPAPFYEGQVRPR